MNSIDHNKENILNCARKILIFTEAGKYNYTVVVKGNCY